MQDPLKLQQSDVAIHSSVMTRTDLDPDLTRPAVQLVVVSSTHQLHSWSFRPALVITLLQHATYVDAMHIQRRDANLHPLLDVLQTNQPFNE